MIKKQKEYNLPEVKDRQFLIAMHKKAKKSGFNLDDYNRMKQEAARIENDLKRLHDPLYLRMSPTSSYSIYTAGQTEKDRLFQTALGSPTVAALDKQTKTTIPISQRLAGFFGAAAKKLKK